MTIVEGGSPTSPPKRVSPTKYLLWSDDAFHAIKFIGINLPFPKYFSGDYKVVCNNLSLNLYNLKETHLLRVLLMEHDDWEKHSKANKEPMTKLSNYK